MPQILLEEHATTLFVRAVSLPQAQTLSTAWGREVPSELYRQISFWGKPKAGEQESRRKTPIFKLSVTDSAPIAQAMSGPLRISLDFKIWD